MFFCGSIGELGEYLLDLLFGQEFIRIGVGVDDNMLNKGLSLFLSLKLLNLKGLVGTGMFGYNYLGLVQGGCQFLFETVQNEKLLH